MRWLEISVIHRSLLPTDDLGTKEVLSALHVSNLVKHSESYLDLPRSNVRWDLHIVLATVIVESIGSPVVRRNVTGLSNLEPVGLGTDGSCSIVNLSPRSVSVITSMA